MCELSERRKGRARGGKRGKGAFPLRVGSGRGDFFCYSGVKIVGFLVRFESYFNVADTVEQMSMKVYVAAPVSRGD